MKLWYGIYSQLSAAEALNVVDRRKPDLNARGKRILDYLRRRYSRGA